MQGRRVCPAPFLVDNRHIAALVGARQVRIGDFYWSRFKPMALANTDPAPVNRPSLASGVSEILSAYFRADIWRTLAAADIRSRYRRTVLGPFWITLSTALMAAGVGLLFGSLFGHPMHEFLPFFMVGIVIWTFILGTVNEASQTLIFHSSFIKSTATPVICHVLRMLHRNFIIFLHNCVIIIAVCIYFAVPVTLQSLWFLWGLAMLYICLLAGSIIISFACVRYRDLPPMIAAGMQFLFFASPILWPAEKLPTARWILEINPVTHVLRAVRDPIVGSTVSFSEMAIMTGLAAASAVVAALVYGRYRHRVVYWV